MLAQKQILLTGAILGFLGVALGAFGAHALKPTLLANGRLDTFELAVRYHFFHALALLLVGILLKDYSHSLIHYSATAFVIGVLLFSGSLYLLAITGFTKLAIVTPIGGLFMLAGWLLLALGIFKIVK